MSATLKAGWLKDSQGNKFAPKTMSSQVIKDDGTLLEEKINLDLSELRQYTNDELAKKADKEHDHEITDVNGLQSALDEKDIAIENIKADAANMSVAILAEAQKCIEEVKTDLDALEDVVNNKANTTHSHVITDVTNLQDALDEKVSISRTINGKELSSNITLSASDVGASESNHNHDDKYYTEAEIDTKLNSKLNTSLKGAKNGLAELDSNGKVPSSQLPSYVDDVLEYDYYSNFPSTGETGKIYIDKTNNKTYRWSGSAFVEISASLALGETSSTAYRGDRGKTAYDHSQSTHAPSNAERNIIVGIQKNGTDVSVYSSTRKVNITVPTKVSELTNDKNYLTSHQDISGKLDKTGDASNVTNAFTTASLRANLTTGEKLSVSLGKIMKYFSDLKTVAFTGSYNDLSNKPTIPSAYAHPSYTARTGVPTGNQAPGFGGTFTVTQPVSDGTGHITAMNSRTITIPNAVATTSANGLMSSSDKTKLNNAAQVVEVTQAQYNSLGSVVNTNGIFYLVK